MKEIDGVDKKFGHTTIKIYYLINANYKFNCQQISYLLNMKKKKATTKEKGKKKKNCQTGFSSDSTFSLFSNFFSTNFIGVTEDCFIVNCEFISFTDDTFWKEELLN